MARIRWIDESKAEGAAGEAYARWFRDNPGRTSIPGILKCLSQSPELFEAMDQASAAVHFRDGALTRRQKEMIATYVSAINRCPY